MLMLVLNAMTKANAVKVSNKQQVKCSMLAVRLMAFIATVFMQKIQLQTPTIVGVGVVGLLPRHSKHIC